MQFSLLPYSIQNIGFVDELIVLLWRFVEICDQFVFHANSAENLHQLLVPLLFHMHLARKNPAKQGMVHTISFILLKLSSYREFGVSLNRKIPTVALLDIRHEFDCLADMLILVLHKCIVSSQNGIRVAGNEQVESLWHMLFTCIANISPYLTRLCLSASVKLVSLFQILSNPSFIAEAPENHRYLLYMIEVFNNLIQYQFSGNSYLVYAILRRRHLFRMLEGFKMECPSEFSFEWFESFKSNVSLQTILRLIDHIVPVMDSLRIEYAYGSFFCLFSIDSKESDSISFLSQTTLVGILPLPHSILVRRYQPCISTAAWFTIHLWGVIFTRQQVLPIFDPIGIRLFNLDHKLPENVEEEQDI